MLNTKKEGVSREEVSAWIHSLHEVVPGGEVFYGGETSGSHYTIPVHAAHLLGKLDANITHRVHVGTSAKHGELVMVLLGPDHRDL